MGNAGVPPIRVLKRSADNAIIGCNEVLDVSVAHLRCNASFIKGLTHTGELFLKRHKPTIRTGELTVILNARGNALSISDHYLLHVSDNEVLDLVIGDVEGSLHQRPTATKASEHDVFNSIFSLTKNVVDCLVNTPSKGLRIGVRFFKAIHPVLTPLNKLIVLAEVSRQDAAKLFGALLNCPSVEEAREVAPLSCVAEFNHLLKASDSSARFLKGARQSAERLLHSGSKLQVVMQSSEFINGSSRVKLIEHFVKALLSLTKHLNLSADVITQSDLRLAQASLRKLRVKVVESALLLGNEVSDVVGLARHPLSVAADNPLNRALKISDVGLSPVKTFFKEVTRIEEANFFKLPLPPSEELLDRLNRLHLMRCHLLIGNLVNVEPTDVVIPFLG